MTIFAVCNEKGGVAKTTTALNLGAALGELLAADGRAASLFDLDAQGDLCAFGGGDGLPIVAATPSGLKPLLAKLPADGIAILDCPPTLGKETAAALRVADFAIVPVNAEYSAVRGLERLKQTLEAARSAGNIGLRHKVLLTMFDTRAGHCHTIEEFAEKSFGGALLKTRIRRSYAFADAALARQTILEFAPRSRGAKAYRDLAREILPLCSREF